MMIMSISNARALDMVGSQAAALSAISCPIPTVFVAVGDGSVRDTLESQICSSGWQAETFETAEQFLALPPVQSPSCLVLDIALPGLKDIDLQERVTSNHVDMPIILTNGHGNVLMVVRAAGAGAAEFVTRTDADGSLLSAIRQGLACSEAAQRREAEVRALADRYATLSRREREVMALVVTGLLNKQVAGELGISEITVKAHRGRVMQKMKATSFAALVNIAAKLGIPRQAPPN